jgi:hypothetical protein
VRRFSQASHLAGSTPKKTFAAVVIVHGSDPVKKRNEFAKRLCQEGIALTYDKRELENLVVYM